MYGRKTTEKSTKLNGSTKEMGEDFEEANSETKNNQKLLSIEVNLDDSEDEIVDNKSATKYLPINANFSKMMKES